MIKVHRTTGTMEGARQVSSPNQDARPEVAGIEVLIVHAISLPPGEFGGSAIERLFCNRLDPAEHPYYREIRDLKVSAHLLIDRGGAAIQFVSLLRRAWHAGESYCEGRVRVNDFSVGIELEGTDCDPFEDAQYRCLADVTRALMQAYPQITPRRIYGHSDIAPGRKTDPGPGFDWRRYLDLLG